MGVIVSKLHGARAIQLPNKTHKVVAGIIEVKDLLNLLGAPIFGGSDHSKIKIQPN